MFFSKRQKIQSFDDEELDIDEAYKLKKKEDPSKLRCSIKLLIIMIALFIVGVFIKLNDYKGDQISDIYTFTTCSEGKYSNRNQCQFCNYKCLKCTDVYGLCIQCEKDYQPDHNGVCKKKLEKEILIKQYNNIPYYLNVGQQQEHFFVILQDNIYDTFKYNLNYTFITIDTYNLMQQKGQIIDEKFINNTLDSIDKIKKQNFTSKILISYGCKQQQAFGIHDKSAIFDQLFIINPVDQDCEQYINDDLLNQNYKPFQKQKILDKNLNHSISYLFLNQDCKNRSKRLLMQQFRIIGDDGSDVKVNSQETESKESNKSNSANSTNSATTNSTNQTDSINSTNITEVKQNEKSNDTIIEKKNITQESTNGNISEVNKTESNQTNANITQDQNKTISSQNETDSKNIEQSKQDDSTSENKQNKTNAKDSDENEKKSDQESEEQKESEEQEISEEIEESEESKESEITDQLQSDDKGSSEETLKDSVDEKKIEIKCYKLNDNYLSRQGLLDQISYIIKNQTQI